MRVYWQNELTKNSPKTINMCGMTYHSYWYQHDCFPFCCVFVETSKTCRFFFMPTKITWKIRKKKNSVRGETGLSGLDLLGGPRRSGNASLVVMRNSPSQYDPPPLQKICQMLPSQVNRKPFWTSWAMRTVGWGWLKVEDLGLMLILIFLWVLIFGEPLLGGNLMDKGIECVDNFQVGGW